MLALCNVDDGAYALYRNSILGEPVRIHVATFDAKEINDYNSENCLPAAKLLQEQPGVRTRFWCEKGTLLFVMDTPT